MLTCFNIEAEKTVAELHTALAEYTEHMQNLELIESTGRIRRRQSDTLMDTDEERDHEFFIIMSFRDRAQCDRAVEHILSREEPGRSIHEVAYSMIKDPVFTCWEDV
jgi:hypothetical protein